MLTGIGLRNFKAFGDEMQEAPLSKITLIYGPNSGGKSSIIQALLLLKQSLKNNYLTGGDHDTRRKLVPRDELVDLGSFQALLHKHEMARELELSIMYRNLDHGVKSTRNNVNLTFSERVGSGDLTKVGYGIHYIDNSNHVTLLNATLQVNENSLIGHYDEDGYSGRYPSEWNTDYTILRTKNKKVSYLALMDFLPTLCFSELRQLRENEKESVEQKRRTVVERIDAETKGPTIIPIIEQEAALRARDLRLGEAIGESEWAFDWDERLGRSIDRDFERALKCQDLTPEQTIMLIPENIPNDYKLHLSLINYLGPQRSSPQRLYRVFSAEDIDITRIPFYHLIGALAGIYHSDALDNSSNIAGTQGEFAANVLYRNDHIRIEVNNWFKRFKIPYELAVIEMSEAPLAGEHIAIALYLLDKEGRRIQNENSEDVAVTLADVGYGINQLLPIIVEGIASQPNSTLCVEQPEIHLHPRLQANIADLLIDTIVDEPGKRKQWIVETHSELLIRRIRTRIAQGDISPSDVSVLYVDPDDDDYEGSAIKELRLDENGYWLDEWPHGFFDDGYRQSKLARRARLAKDKKNAGKFRS